MKHVGCAHKCHAKMHTRAQVAHPKGLLGSLLARKKGQLGQELLLSCTSVAGLALLASLFRKGETLSQLALIKHNTAAGFPLGFKAGKGAEMSRKFPDFIHDEKAGLQQTQPCAS